MVERRRAEPLAESKRATPTRGMKPRAGVRGEANEATCYGVDDAVRPR